MTTQLSDVIQPEVFTDYVVQRSMEKSELIQSGIIQRTAQFDQLASGPNVLVNMPFWNDLASTESQVMKDEGEMQVNKITAGLEIARKHGRVNAWGANGLSAYLSGDDPMGRIAELVADYWRRDMQRTLLATLSGVFKSSSMSEKVFDVSDDPDGVLGMDTFIDAIQLMGDAKETLTGVMMHSAVEAELRKQDLIEYIPQSEQGLPIPTFAGKRVIVDDAMEYDPVTNTATMYIFGEGAIALGIGSHPRIVATEVYRNPKSYSGEEALINRRIFILHPRGVSWQEPSSGLSGEFPSNNELNVGGRWIRVYEPKAIPIVKFRFKLKPDAEVDDPDIEDIEIDED